MSDTEAEGRTQDLVFEYRLDAPPDKVWRAISIPAFREKWLPAEALASPRPVSSVPGEEVRYRVRDDEPPFLESVVTLRIAPAAGGGTTLRIVHSLTDERLQPQAPSAANDGWFALMRAA